MEAIHLHKKHRVVGNTDGLPVTRPELWQRTERGVQFQTLVISAISTPFAPRPRMHASQRTISIRARVPIQVEVRAFAISSSV